MATKNRKTIMFSSKNTDLFEHLVKMQKKGENVSEYLCNLIRADLEMTVKKDEFEEVKTQVHKIEEMLSELMKNGIVAQPILQQEEDEVKMVSVSDEEMEIEDDEDADALLDLFDGMMPGDEDDVEI